MFDRFRRMMLQYGLYSSFMASFVYIVFGSCENITIGPTAIMASMIQDLVRDYGSDMAVLIAFLKGCIIALLGIFHLGNSNARSLVRGQKRERVREGEKEYNELVP